MPNGDHMDLYIKGLKITALPDTVEIKTKTVGQKGNDNTLYSLDLKDIPKGKRYLKIRILTGWC